MTCPSGSGDVRGGIRWSASGPAGRGVDVQVLVHQAVERLLLEGPDIGIVPRPEGTGLVGMPVWMWSGPGPVTHLVGVGRGGHGRRDGLGARVVDG
ncbi:hypothetical protein OG321_39860 [Streptomyces sp. NBC_00424]|uniref:hypothetical protein n=1 Tax=Streptomyces sp. NBC_00424 TaxID=2903648 RepID=UPI00225BF4C8|nr:hypothetical protein [Streptomyces sp. NBC_00424]MCX5078577.1 hypothetical protein [Streptomyces sp. NBC_00424]